jgi:hypothetical protein
MLYIVLYHHRHGTDAWLASSEADATRQCVGVVLENIGDLDDNTALAVLGKIAEGDFGPALAAYCEAADEGFETRRATAAVEEDDTEALRTAARDLLAERKLAERKLNDEADADS